MKYPTKNSALFNFLLLVVFFTMSACFTFITDSDEDTGNTEWETAFYEFEQRFVCFCVEPAGRFQRILVKENKILSIVDAVSEAPLAEDKYRFFKTVSQLFELVNTTHPDSVAMIRVTYDSTYGYPNEIYIDYYENIADDEIGTESRNMRLLR